MFAQTTGTRALRAWKRLQSYLTSKLPRPWVAEDLVENNQGPLPAVLQQQEIQTAQNYTAGNTAEFVDLFTLDRDLRYRRRNRRWLWARAQQTKLDAAYEQWAMFVRLNRQAERLTQLPSQDAEQLSRLSAAETRSAPGPTYTNLVMVQKA